MRMRSTFAIFLVGAIAGMIAMPSYGGVGFGLPAAVKHKIKQLERSLPLKEELVTDTNGWDSDASGWFPASMPQEVLGERTEQLAWSTGCEVWKGHHKDGRDISDIMTFVRAILWRDAART